MSAIKWFEIPVRSVGRVTALVTLLMACMLPNKGLADRLAISSVSIEEESTVVISCQVPAGLKQVVLEARRRVELGAWEPVTVRHVEGVGGEMTFRVSLSAALGVFRLRAAPSAALPASFYEGPSSFEGPIVAGGPDDATRDFYQGPEVTTEPNRDAGTESGGAREVVESDIWKLRGETLFFFNQLQGLQVIDVSNPDEPTMTGSLELPAAGEQMYLLDEHVVLLARDGCTWSRGEPRSRILIVNVTDGRPEVVAERPVFGTIQESRMVGSALYIASRGYRPSDVDEVSPEPDPERGVGLSSQEWEIGTTITAFNLSSPEEPVKRETLWYPGYGNVVKATPEYLFVAQRTQSYPAESEIQVIDISSIEGEMRFLSRIRPAGWVQDKYKMHVKENVFTAISQRREPREPMQTVLETYSLASPERPEQLGSLVLVEEEQLHATRFKDDLAYVVTFFQVDPLWIVDLSDPADPTITGELEVPGFSTFIYPLEDELLTIGMEERRVAVSLFDVSDRTAPKLASKVRIGEKFSSSEANYDEKAFGVFPEDGLALVPYTSYSGDGRRINGVQLIDLSKGSLTERGVIRHAFQPRRATVYQERILSFSEWALLSVNAEDRDAPEIMGQLELAWPVERVFERDAFLVTLGQRQELMPHLLPESSETESEWRATLRVVDKGEPGKTVTLRELAPMSILGASQRGDFLYILQAESLFSNGGVVDDSNDEEEGPTVPLRLTVWDLSALPDVERVGLEEVDVAAGSIGVAGEVKAVWPEPDLLVWGSVDRGMYWPLARPVGPEPGLDVAILPGYRYWGSGGGRLFAYDVVEPTAPKWLAKVDLSTNDDSRQRWNVGEVFAADGKVYLSMQSSRYIPPPEPLDGGKVTEPDVVAEEPDGQNEKEGLRIRYPEGYWMQQYFLDVVDFAEPAEPVARKPVNIPGELIGLSHQGNLIYTQGRHWERNDRGGVVSDGTNWLDVSVYDGASVHLVDSLALPERWPHPVKVTGNRIYIGDPSESISVSPSTVEIWTLPDSGDLEMLGEISIEAQAEALNIWGDLLGVHGGDLIQAFDVTDPGAASHVKTDTRDGCYNVDLDDGDGSLQSGLWLPLGNYGIKAVPFGAP